MDSLRLRRSLRVLSVTDTTHERAPFFPSVHQELSVPDIQLTHSEGLVLTRMMLGHWTTSTAYRQRRQNLYYHWSP